MHTDIDAITAYLRHIAIDLLRIGEPVTHDALALHATQTMADTDPAAIHEAAEEVAQCFVVPSIEAFLDTSTSQTRGNT